MTPRRKDDKPRHKASRKLDSETYSFPMIAIKKEGWHDKTEGIEAKGLQDVSLPNKCCQGGRMEIPRHKVSRQRDSETDQFHMIFIKEEGWHTKTQDVKQIDGATFGFHAIVVKEERMAHQDIRRQGE